jgi:hypothetical protein
LTALIFLKGFLLFIGFRDGLKIRFGGISGYVFFLEDFMEEDRTDLFLRWIRETEKKRKKLISRIQFFGTLT